MPAWELHDGSEQAGPFEEDHVVRMILHGIPPGTLARRVGTEDWKGLRTHAPFAMALEKLVPASQEDGKGGGGDREELASQEPGLAARTAASSVRIIGALVLVFGLVGTIPGCIFGGPVGFLVAMVAAVLGLLITRVEA